MLQDQGSQQVASGTSAATFTFRGKIKAVVYGLYK